MPDPLAELFSSRVRAAVLTLVLPRPHLGFSLTDLSRRLGLPVSSLQHECYKLTRLGLLRDERVGNARLYRPDPTWPLLEPLTALTVRAVPLQEALRGAIERVPGIDGAWVSGDLSSRSDPVYLVVLGDLGVEELDGIFDRCRVALVPIVGAGRVELGLFSARRLDGTHGSWRPLRLGAVQGPTRRALRVRGRGTAGHGRGITEWSSDDGDLLRPDG